MTPIRKEFDAAYCKEHSPGDEGNPKEYQDSLYWVAIWAAKWMAEKCRQEICGHDGVQKVTHRFCCEHSSKIRNLAKELSQ